MQDDNLLNSNDYDTHNNHVVAGGPACLRHFVFPNIRFSIVF